MTYVYDFAEGDKDQKDLLGGKGANLAEMTNLGLPVPPGFTISTEACRAYLPRAATPDGLADEVTSTSPRSRRRWAAGSATPTTRCWSACGPGRQVLDARDDGDGPQRRPQRRVGRAAWPRRASDERFAHGLLPPAAADVRRHRARHRVRAVRRRPRQAEEGSRAPTPTPTSTSTTSRRWSRRSSGMIREHAGRDFPQDPREQLDLAMRAVFDSWNTDRAVLYRRQERIPEDLGTAVNVQAMVFGNRGDDSGSGVALHPRPGLRRPGRVRRLPAERPGRGRRRRHPQHGLAGRHGRDRPEVARRAARDHGEARAALPRHVRHRVHRRARQALDAADPGRQAHARGGVPDRRPHGRRGPDRHGRGAAARHRRRSWPS